MANSQPIQFKVHYLLLLLPFALAFLSWLYFPTLASGITESVFGYIPTKTATNIFWLGTVNFFYSWYTFVAIGLSGAWITAAYLSRKKPIKTRRQFNPLVSFIIPAYNQEKNIANCIKSLFRCIEKYEGTCEVIIVDDGSTDKTYELATETLRHSKVGHPLVGGKVIRHSTNSGKIEALKTGLNRAMGGLVAIVDADSEWAPETLAKVVNYKLSNGKKAVTGFIQPNGQGSEGNLLVKLQRLEYSQSLGVGRCAQSLGDNVLVVPGALGLYDANVLRETLMDRSVRSVTEDLEVTLEMHKKGAHAGYVNFARSETVAPLNLKALWHQRLRWLTGWLHNTLGLHKDLMKKPSSISMLLWYSYIFEFTAAFIDVAALVAFPLLWIYAPDQLFFGLNLLLFIPYGFLIGLINQAIALHYAYGNFNHENLLFYTPLYPVLWLVNVSARIKSIINYSIGNNGEW